MFQKEISQVIGGELDRKVAVSGMGEDEMKLRGGAGRWCRVSMVKLHFHSRSNGKILKYLKTGKIKPGE